MTTKTQHSPTPVSRPPWKIVNRQHGPLYDTVDIQTEQGAVVMVAVHPDDAAHIVRCVNAHDKLAEALRKAIEELRHCSCIVGDPMYAATKKEYRATLRDIVADAQTALREVEEDERIEREA